LLGLSAQTTTQVTATKHPFLWRIDGRGEQTFEVKSWLYGTMHSGDERLVTLPESVEHARQSADALYCEVEMDRTQKQREKTIRKMLLPEGQTLRDRLPKKLYQRLSDYLANRGIRIRTINRLQVWAMTLWLDRIDSEREKLTKHLDLMLYQDAKAAGKEVGGLETSDEQLGAHVNAREQDCIEVLRRSLDYKEGLAADGIRPSRRLLEAYLAGDGARILAQLHEAMGEDKELVKRFLKPSAERNVRMADRMAKMMTKHPQRSYFFAVGALHCFGKDSVVDLLRKKGYRITRVDAPKKVQTESRPSKRKRPRRRLVKLSQLGGWPAG